MRRAFLAVSGLMLLLSAGPALAGPAVSLPAEVKGEPGDFIQVAATTDGKEVRWVSFDPSLRVFPPALLKDTKTAVVIARGPGRFKLLAYTAAGDVPSDPAFTVIVIGDAPPPVPPGPTPPVPPVPPTPVPGANLRVLITEETAERSKLPAAQLAILFDKRVRDYLNAKCPAGPDGKTKEWGIYDTHTDLTQLSKGIQELKKPSTASLPWISLSTDTGKYDGPLPATVEATLELLKKWGG